MKSMADGEKSHNCLEGDRFPSADMYLSLQSIYRFGLEGADMNEIKKCFKCGIEEGIIRKLSGIVVKIIRHHLNYKTGTVVDCCVSCHRKIHANLRKNNACPLSVKAVAELSHKSSVQNYAKNNNKFLSFHETLIPNVFFREIIRYNFRTGNITYAACFCAEHHKELKYVEC